MDSPLDTKQRPLGSLRLSVTDRCNLRCQYCMPEENYRWLKRKDILSFEELSRVVDLFLKLGVKRFRLTGGEPLLRQDMAKLVEVLSQKPGLEDLALTTNGILLSEQAKELKQAGLHRITLSLDTLQESRFEQFTRRAQFSATLRGLQAAQTAGFNSIKINTVVIRGFNDQEVGDLLRFAKEHKVMLRFIEYMDVGGATLWDKSQVITQQELLHLIETEYGPAKPLLNRGSSPASMYVLADGTPFGIIASTTAPFCGSCDRARITADGTLLTCLYAKEGVNLRNPLRKGHSDVELLKQLAEIWRRRSDEGALERHQMGARGPLIPLPILQDNPHLEMHTRGG